MTFDDFDITFCHGTDGDNFCPKRESCKRYWSDLTEKQAEKLGLKYHSFFQPDNVDTCDMYWKTK